ncbi:MAG: hypothetical protein AUH68_02175 [Gemmatimonadetes bacterium 13_1_40CM_4_69_5]|nr:MAG: hypothetical protein AUH68_02175 [Gemmatimonadetes bacterium 13_1_40CM_4_69_5]
MNELVGIRFSGSSSRSKPSGASKRPKLTFSAEAPGGVQLTMRLSTSISVVVAPLSPGATRVVSWPKR